MDISKLVFPNNTAWLLTQEEDESKFKAVDFEQMKT